MNIPITFLGTGQAIPTPRRNHTSILLQYKDENILIDCGEGTQRQIRKAKLNPCSITKLLITHWHGDHILGIPGLLQTLALSGYNKQLEVYGPRGTLFHMNKIMNMFVFQGAIKYKVIEVEGKFFENSDFALEALPMTHGAPCLAYSFIEKAKTRINKEKLEKLKIKGKIIAQLAQGKDILWNNKKIKAEDLTYSQPEKKISIILDTSLNKNMEKIAENADLLICESTYTKKDEDASGFKYHLTAEQAAETAKKAKVKKLILTHISQRYEFKEKFILAEARKIFKNSEVVEDLSKVEV
jgi:ribonuclease Z